MNNILSKAFHPFFRKNETGLHTLNYLFWECTQRCNLACRHCGSDCMADAKVRDMPFNDFLTAILPLKNYAKPNSITVVITGGEPLLRKDLADCGMQLRRNGFRWGMVTNGYFYDENVHARMLSAGIGAITLSLDGLALNHNWLRNNPKSFGQAENALDLITSSKRLNYDVVTCVNKRNLSELPELKNYLISKKVKAWRLFTIAPIGRAAADNELQMSGTELKTLMDFIVEARKDKRIAVNFSCEAFVGNYEGKVRDNRFFCRAGINIGSVLIDGSISACPNINRNFVQGNIYKDDFLDVWNNRFQIMRDKTWCKSGICKTCADFHQCNGGAMHLYDNEKKLLVCHSKNLYHFL